MDTDSKLRASDQELSQPLVVRQGYSAFYKPKNGQAVKCVPMTNNTILEEVRGDLAPSVHDGIVVGLPDDRVFVIGGSFHKSGRDPVKDCYELTKGHKTQKTQMFLARSNFGSAVYPNFSQIFIAGGSVSENEATKSCERYIVKDD